MQYSFYLKPVDEIHLLIRFDQFPIYSRSPPHIIRYQAADYVSLPVIMNISIKLGKCDKLLNVYQIYQFTKSRTNEGQRNNKIKFSTFSVS